MEIQSNFRKTKKNLFLLIFNAFCFFNDIFGLFIKLFNFFLSGKFIKSNKFYKLTGRLRRRRSYRWLNKRWWFRMWKRRRWKKKRTLFKFKIISIKFIFFFLLLRSVKFLNKTNLIFYFQFYKKKINMLKKKNELKKYILFKTHKRKKLKFSFINFQNKYIRRFLIFKRRRFWKLKKRLVFGNFKKQLKLKQFKRRKFRKVIPTKRKLQRTKKLLDCRYRFKSLLYENRNILTFFFFGIKKLRQKVFNKYFSNILKYNSFALLFTWQFNIVQILLRSRFCFISRHIDFLFKNNFVFVNGINILNQTHIVAPGDVIQLRISVRFYKYYRKIKSHLFKLKRRTGKRIWRYTRVGLHSFKQRAEHTPNWLYKLMYLRFDVPKFLELDYTILTVVFLKLPNFFFEFDFFFLKFVNLFLMRLYNWRYII